MVKAKALSGLQRDVLKLYRMCIRACHKKPEDTRMNFVLFARQEFRKFSSIKTKDFTVIEHLLRKGARNLDLYANPGVRNVNIN
ncbi:hypothetical protein NADFUDRAFT_83885 [Nadsonia fulvescens var. elongata DSM 6958]|uniref:Complex 1 LYR protein domain-containing protein n=1 Tax=Nadsonia fulvescens var. elongata DSM 6958 TaxID=857566 RepID=A0A1E3PHI4_9ASCO|nr:hypothetical protein NADFUDRAFT_83885 [Nadsonia fulvescens var. elongata DSM 6958]